MSSDLTDESMKDESEAYYSTLISKVGHKVAKTAKKTKKSAKNAAKQTQENIMANVANATSLLERTIQMTDTSKRTHSSFGGGNDSNNSGDGNNTTNKKSDTLKKLAEECARAVTATASSPAADDNDGAEPEDTCQSTLATKEIPTKSSESKVPYVRKRTSVIQYFSSKNSLSSEAEEEQQQQQQQQQQQPKIKENAPATDPQGFRNPLDPNIHTIPTIKEEIRSDRLLLYNPSILAILVALLLAACKGFTNYSEIWDNSVPVHVALTWAALTLMVGVEIGRIQSAKEFQQYLTLQSTIYEKARQQQLLDGNQPSHMVQQQQQQHHQSSNRGPCPSSDDQEEEEEEEEEEIPTSRFRKVLDKVQKKMRKRTSWTTLGSDPKRKRQKWERSGNVLVSNSLTKALSTRAPDNRRKSLANLGVSEEELQDAIQDESLFVGNGTIDDPERMIARSLEDDAIEPLCRLRGMDVFITESAETDLALHPFLIQNGLRDRPTFVINVLTQWGNVAIYSELPNWITSWDEVFIEQEDDPEDVIALKRFLNGDDDYRNLRFKCLPVLVDGPGPMRYMAPPKETCTVVSESLPSSWKFHPPKVDSTTGETTLYPCLELESDLMANRTMRATAALVKRYLGSMVGDVAVVIEKPWGQEEDEPRACLGMCRFDRIDVKTCPEMPPRKEEEYDDDGEDDDEEGETSAEDQDILRANAMLGQQPAHTQEECPTLRQQPLRQTR